MSTLLCPVSGCGVSTTKSGQKPHLTLAHGFPSCPKCPRIVKHVGYWHAHVLNDKEHELFECDIDGCAQQYLAIDKKDHLMECHRFPCCPKCGAVVKTVGNWRHHVLSCEGRQRCDLDGCSVHFRASDKTNHLTECHGYPSCPVEGCSDVFDHIPAWKNHVIVCVGKVSRECPYFQHCGFSAPNIASIKRHLMDAHRGHLKEGDTSTVFNCRSCGMDNFGNLEMFREHLGSCIYATMYTCDVCNNDYSSRQQLNRHVCTAAGEAMISSRDFVRQLHARSVLAVMRGTESNPTAAYATELQFQEIPGDDGGISPSHPLLFMYNPLLEPLGFTFLDGGAPARLGVLHKLYTLDPAYIWLMLVHQLKLNTMCDKTGISVAVNGALQRAEIPASLVAVHGEANMRSLDFIEHKCRELISNGERRQDLMVYESNSGRKNRWRKLRYLQNDLLSIHANDRHLLATTSLPSASDASNLSECLMGRLTLNAHIKFERAQLRSVYSFLRDFGREWYHQHGCMFARGGRTPGNKWDTWRMSDILVNFREWSQEDVLLPAFHWENVNGNNETVYGNFLAPMEAEWMFRNKQDCKLRTEWRAGGGRAWLCGGRPVF